MMRGIFIWGLSFISTKIMKKINNKKTIDIYIRILMVMLVLLPFAGIIIYMLKPISSYLLASVFCIVGFILVFYTFIKLRLFEYENSLQFISIKQPYIWKINPSDTPIEFPIDKLAGFNIHEGLFITTLMLMIRSKEQKTKILYCNITGLNKKQISELKQSLQIAKKYAEN